MKERVVADLSRLPLHGMGSASMTWWGTLAFMLIEGTGFALAIAVYLYLMSVAATWPIDAPRPDLLPGDDRNPAPASQPRAKLPRCALGRAAGSSQGRRSAWW